MATKSETKTTKCPKCGKVNHDADADGAVEGPRAYHAACWQKMSAAAKARALAN